MKQKIYSLFSIVISLTLISSIVTVQAFAANNNEVVTQIVGSYYYTIVDDADILTSEEEQKIGSHLSEIVDYCSIIVATGNGSGYSTAESYYKKYSNGDAVIFYIDMKDRTMWIYNEGSTQSKMTVSRANEITDNVYKYATNGDYYNCIIKATDQIYTVMSGGVIFAPMRYINNLFIAIGAAAIIMFGLITFNRRDVSGDDYKGKKSSYIARNSQVDLDIDSFVLVSKTSRDSGSGGSGGSGGGGGGGGGSGGGHSF